MSYYEEPDDSGLNSMRSPIETVGALNIGLLVFAFSRLDASLERFLDRVSPVAGSPSNSRALSRLMAYVDQLSDSPLRTGFRHWIVRVHGLQDLRKAVLGGRWIPDMRRDCLVLDAPDASRTEYRVSELVASLALVNELQAGFQELCVIERAAA